MFPNTKFTVKTIFRNTKFTTKTTSPNTKSTQKNNYSKPFTFIKSTKSKNRTATIPNPLLETFFSPSKPITSAVNSKTTTHVIFHSPFYCNTFADTVATACNNFFQHLRFCESAQIKAKNKKARTATKIGTITDHSL